ncbi:MAG: ATP synthase F0 subunit B [Oscillospiraceae bacterium]|jgi:F-type H+-transporting ATPase subunit b|nr:ATP synthase F0 subunit B [Oscillospiraceae bacterium]MDE6996966.1 ATP synthase F0 subunit B [Oscillospiraceae bacterium]
MPLNINFQQIFLHLLNFTILFAAMYFLLYKPVKSFMDKRAAYYTDLDRQAQEKLEEAERVRLDYQHKLEAAAGEIQEKSAQAQKLAMEAAEQQLKKAQAEAAHVVAKASAEAKAEKERIIHEARGEVEEMIAVVAEKLILANTSAAYDQFLEAAGKEEQDA